VNGASERSHDAQVKLHDGIDSLNQLAAQLATAMETLEEPSIPSVENGLDFYDEVRKFEISLIQRALQLTGGVQNKAAHILNLKHTTLNTKIKQYKLG
jgi:DNA-binding NtrC family response regulator